MSYRSLASAAVIIVLAFAAGCAVREATLASTPEPRTATPAPTAAAPTQTPVPPANAPPPTETPQPPTPTPVLSTETPTPTSESSFEPPSIAEVIASLKGLPVDAFLEASYRQLQLRDPDTLISNGLAGVYDIVPGDHFTDLSAAYALETQQLEREMLDLLRAYDRNTLSTEQQVSYDALAWYLTTPVEGHAFADHRFLVNPVWGLQRWPIDFLTEYYPLESRQDAERCIARLSSLDTWVEQVIERLEGNEEAGAIPPRYVVEDTVEQLNGILETDGTSPPEVRRLDLYADFRTRIRQIDGLSDAEQDTLLDAASQELEQTFIPAYARLRDHLARLTMVAIEDPNGWQLPGGEAYYAHLLRYYTGTDLSADEIHNLGLANVARLQADIRNAATALGYPADIRITDLSQRMSEDREPITGSELRQEYERILAAADQAVGDVFDLRTSAEVVIRPVREGPPACYNPPEPGSDEPGVMPVRLGISPLMVNYNEHVLVHHETIPGHHTQVALAQELDLPEYQRFDHMNHYMQRYDFQAYVEGWTWYGEVLAWEIGLYEDDRLANLERLRLYLVRAVRMLVDTGIHAKGWTRQEAATAYEQATGRATEPYALDRYVILPGQGCGYTPGLLKILQLRDRAEAALRDGFDIKAFHNVILGYGPMPLVILERVVDDWIETETQQSSSAGMVTSRSGPTASDGSSRALSRLPAGVVSPLMGTSE